MDVSDYGKTTSEMPKGLLDDHILSNLKNNRDPLEGLAQNGGFAEKFYSGVKERLGELKSHNIISLVAGVYGLQHNWKKHYEKLLGKAVDNSLKR